MMNETCSTREHFCRRSCHERHIVFSAHAICSIVSSDNCGFFSPELSRLLGHEQNRQLAQRHVSHQSAIGTSFVMVEANLALGDTEDVLDAPARESHPQEFFQTGFWRGVGDEVLHLSGFNVAGDNQPVSAIGGPASHFGSVARALEPDLCASDFPDLRAQGLTTQGETLPRLTLERLSP